MLMPLRGAIAQTGETLITPAPASAPAQEYLLGAGDVIDVFVVGRDDFKQRTQIASDGTVRLPLIGTVQASDRSTRQLEQEVASLLKRGGYFSNPEVAVAVVTASSRYVIVLGAVGSPGLVTIDRAYRVSEILARVGGVRDSAADYVVLSNANAKEQRLPLTGITTVGSMSDDPYVSPGDKLYVPSAELFYVYGQVNAPGVYTLLKDMTLRKALARGGGLSPAGSEKSVKVYRDGVQIKRFDLGAMIKPGDVIVVGERFF
jgi:polysaccharide export outer membrane protein